jgi:2',3'-cyclic-nucleotide 2'-phosphodiesterase (5'-nucleotidase family)
MGGLARRVSYTNLFKEKLGHIPSLVVDSGYFLTDERNAHGGLRPDVSTKNDWILKAFDQFTIDVANVSSRDLRHVSLRLAKSDQTGKSQPLPILGRLVSANAVADASEFAALHPFIVREVAADQKPVRVAFIGLTETIPPPPPGWRFIDPVEAAQRVVPEARKQSDIVVVLAHVKADMARRIAQAVPGIDALIAGNSTSNDAVFTPPETLGQTLIAYTPYETRMLGELRFYRDQAGRFTSRARFITLDDEMGDAPAALEMANAADAAETRAREDSKTSLEDWLARSRQRNVGGRSSDQQSPFVGSAACAACHSVQYIRWSNGPHSRATDPLPPRPFEFEASCLQCHATGLKQAGVTTPLQAIQCEQCHGPGADHAMSPAKGYGRIANLQVMCASCHTSATSPGFDARSAWLKIKH